MIKLFLLLLSISLTFGCQSIDSVSREIARDKRGGLFIPYGQDINCNIKSTHFLYVRTREDLTFSDCKSISLYSEEVSKLNSWYPIQRRFGLFVFPIKKLQHLNGYVKPGVFFNNDYSDKLAFFHYSPFEGQSFIEANRSIWNHEYGHLVLNNYIRNSILDISDSAIKSIKSDTEGIKTNEELKEVYSSLEDRLYKIKLDIGDQYEDKILSDLRNQISREMRTAKEKYKSHDVHLKLKHNLIFGERLTYLLAPYHEIFADIFAILYNGEANVIYNAFKEIGLSKEATDNRKFGNTKIDDVISSADSTISHHFFTPVRFSSKKYIEGVISIKKERQFIKKLLEFILADVLKSINNRNDTEFFSYEEMMKDIEALDSFADMHQYFLSRIKNFEVQAPAEVILASCQNNLKNCKEIVSQELQKKDKGLIFTLPKTEEFNRKLYRKIVEISNELAVAE